MKRLLILAVCVPLLVAAQCNSPTPLPPVPTPVADAGPLPVPTPIADAAPAPIADAGPVPVTPAGLACSNMHDAGCDEAKSIAACTKVLQHTLDARLTKVPMACLLTARDKPAVHACGSFVVCP